MPDSNTPVDDEFELTLTGELAELTADTPTEPLAPPLDMDALHRLRRLDRTIRLHKSAAEGLAPQKAELEAKVVDMVLPHTSPDGHWSTTVGGDTGYLSRTLWPKRLTNEETGEPYETDELADALRESGHGRLVSQQVHGQRLAAWVRERVAAWEALVGEEGYRNADGKLADADGVALSGSELDDPTATELALPAAVRRIIGVSPKMTIGFRAR